MNHLAILLSWFRNVSEIRVDHLWFREDCFMAGVAGLEPAGEGVKVPCLTTWRHPYIEAAQNYSTPPGR